MGRSDTWRHQPQREWCWQGKEGGSCSTFHLADLESVFVEHKLCLLTRHDTEEARKKARLEKLAAWKRQQEGQHEPAFQIPAFDDPIDDAPASHQDGAKVW